MGSRSGWERSKKAGLGVGGAGCTFCVKILLWHHIDHLLRDAQVLNVVAADDDLGQAPEAVAVARGQGHLAKTARRGARGSGVHQGRRTRRRMTGQDEELPALT